MAPVGGRIAGSTLSAPGTWNGCSSIPVKRHRQRSSDTGLQDAKRVLPGLPEEIRDLVDRLLALISA